MLCTQHARDKWSIEIVYKDIARTRTQDAPGDDNIVMHILSIYIGLGLQAGSGPCSPPGTQPVNCVYIGQLRVSFCGTFYCVWSSGGGVSSRAVTFCSPALIGCCRAVRCPSRSRVRCGAHDRPYRSAERTPIQCDTTIERTRTRARSHARTHSPDWVWDFTRTA